MARRRKGNRRRKAEAAGREADPWTGRTETQARSDALVRAPAASRARTSTRALQAAVLVAVAAGIGSLVAGQWQAGRSAEHLPALPDLSSFPEAVRDHLTRADEVARAASDSPDAVGALCLAYQADLLDVAAERCYLAVERLEPDEWRWVYLRALVLGERGRADLLAEEMHRVVEMTDFGPAWWRLGEAAFKDGRYDEARDAWTRALDWRAPAPDEDPSRPLDRLVADSASPGGDFPASAPPPRTPSVALAAYARVGLARVAMQRGDLDDARRILTALSVELPPFGQGLRLLSEVYDRSGRPEESERAVRQANRLPPFVPYDDSFVEVLARASRNSTFLLQQYGAAQVSGDLDWGEYLLRRALAFDPDNPDVVLSFGQLLRATGRFDEALRMLRRHQEMVPEDPQALAEVGGALIDVGRLDEAEAVLGEALAELDDAETHYNLGVVLAGKGRLTDAVEQFEAAIARDGNHTNARNNLVAALVRLRDLDAAEREVRALLDLDPEDDRGWTNLGLVYLERGLIERAIPQFRRALQINPEQPQAQQALSALRASASLNPGAPTPR